MNADLAIALSRTKGQREIAAGGDSIGFYSLDYTTVTAAAAKAF
jgi:hypothetical protein